MRTLLSLATALMLCNGTAIAQTSPSPDQQPLERPNFYNPHHGGPFAEALQNLSPEGRQQVESAMKDGREQAKAHYANRKAARDKIRAAMHAEPFNADALRAAFKEESALATKQMQDRHERMVGALSKLSSADRQAFVKALDNMESKRGLLRKRWNDKNTPAPLAP